MVSAWQARFWLMNGSCRGKGVGRTAGRMFILLAVRCHDLGIELENRR